MNKPFRFKEFSVEQDQCAMQIGTDAVLLGAWADASHDPESILDIGTGTGVMALMLAQRSHAHNIDAVEIDGAAFEQAVQNFENSPWSDRLFCYHASFKEFVLEMKEDIAYDLIICNPPFYSGGYTSGNEKRDTARNSEFLPLAQLMEGAGLLLSERGRINLVLPSDREAEILQLAAQNQLFPRRLTRVKGTSTAPVKRCLLELSFEQLTPEVDELVIEVSRHRYTSQYFDLVQDYLLNPREE